VTFDPAAERGGCFSCRYFGERRGVAVLCARPAVSMCDTGRSRLRALGASRTPMMTTR